MKSFLTGKCSVQFAYMKSGGAWNEGTIT